MYNEIMEYLDTWGYNGEGLSVLIGDVYLDELTISGFLSRQWRNLADYAEDEDWRWFDTTAESIFESTTDGGQRDWLTAIVSASQEVR